MRVRVPEIVNLRGVCAEYAEIAANGQNYLLTIKTLTDYVKSLRSRFRLDSRFV